VPGLPTEFSSAAVRADAGESAEGVASRVGKRRRVVDVVEGVEVDGQSPGPRQIA
jgi:hypothetical protein